MAFKPTREDDKGISVVRVVFTSTVSDALVNVPPEKINKFYVAKIPVSQFLALQLTVIPDPLQEEPGQAKCKGHALVIELKLERYENNDFKQGNRSPHVGNEPEVGHCAPILLSKFDQFQT